LCIPVAIFCVFLFAKNCVLLFTDYKRKSSSGPLPPPTGILREYLCSGGIGPDIIIDVIITGGNYPPTMTVAGSGGTMTCTLQ